jgi:bifunctional non-homologous end joining protein LigD
MVVFDLDPGPPAAIVECTRVALRIREVFDDLDLQSFPKTSGSKGLQIYVPLNTPTTYDDTKPFAHAVAQLLERDDPRRVTSRMDKSLRKGKVFIDWSQNDQHKTTVCVYSLRARPEPTVSTPVAWEEVEHTASSGDGEALVFDAPAVLDRVERHGDVFGAVAELHQTLPRFAGATAAG